jgi:hypothetical protein
MQTDPAFAATITPPTGMGSREPARELDGKGSCAGEVGDCHCWGKEFTAVFVTDVSEVRQRPDECGGVVFVSVIQMQQSPLLARRGGPTSKKYREASE